MLLLSAEFFQMREDDDEDLDDMLHTVHHGILKTSLQFTSAMSNTSILQRGRRHELFVAQSLPYGRE